MNKTYLQIKERMEEALVASNRAKDACTLLAVSKTKPAS